MSTPSSPTLSPARWTVVGGLFVLSLITYIDRAAISSAKDAIGTDLRLDDQAMGLVFSVFALGYALGQVPSGALADRLGPRRMLTGIVTLWSLMTALTGAAPTLAILLAVRFLFGIAEAGAFPGSARAIFSWLPPEERGRANGILFSGSRIGGALAFPLMAWLLDTWQWRNAFALLAIPGLVWAFAWALWSRDEPPVPLPKPPAARHDSGLFAMLRTGPMMLALAQYFAINFVTFLCLSWMLPYLKSRFALSTADAALYAMVPLAAGGGAQWASGWLVDRIYASPRRAWSRRIPAIAGFLMAAAGLALVPLAGSPLAAVAAFTVAAFGADMTISPSWAFCIDRGGKSSGALTGAMNMSGNLGSFVSANAFPALAAWTGTTSTYFWLVAVMSLVSAVFWYFMRPPDAAQA